MNNKLFSLIIILVFTFLAKISIGDYYRENVPPAYFQNGQYWGVTYR
ncbi:MAG: hypothetical protein U0T83_09015 [Bacteriovoracaceae bacterium]